MHPIVDSKRAELAELCRRRGVQRLELFGSAARVDFDEAHSDLDFPVSFGADHPGSALEYRFGLKNDLELLFARQVDLVSQDSIRNPYILATIERDRQLLYAA